MDTNGVEAASTNLLRGAPPPASAYVEASIAYLKGNALGLLAAGAGLMLAITAGVLVCVAVVLLPPLPGIALESDPLVLVGLVAGWSAYVVLLLLLTVVAAPLMQASLYRAIDAHLDGGPPLGWRSAFATIRQDAAQVVLVWVLLQIAVLIGAMACYVPGLIVAGMLHLALPLVATRRLGAVEAIRVVFDHARSHIGWHLAVFGAAMLGGAVLQLIPVVGLALGTPFLLLVQVLALRGLTGAPAAASSSAA